MNLVQTIGVCGNVLAGAAQMLPIEICSRVTDQKIRRYIVEYSGVTFGILAHQTILLTGNSTLLANKWVITGVVSGLGTLATKQAAKDLQSGWRERLFICQILANGVLSLVSLYQGRYAFGLSALACTFRVYL